MRKVKEDALRREYRRSSLGRAVRGKYFKAYRGGHNLVLLKPEIAAAFPSEKAVNDALGSLIRLAHHIAG